MKLKVCLVFILPMVILVSSGFGTESKNEPATKVEGGKTPSVSAKTGNAVIHGKVVLNGKAPAGENINADAYMIYKAQQSGMAQEVQVDGKNNLANVLVYVKEGAGNYPVPSESVTLTQKNCQFIPRVFGIQTNQQLVVLNEDPTMHNVHCVPVINDGFNIGQPEKGMKYEVKFGKPELPVKFKCDLHSWMHSLAGVFTHPFFSVTGADGTYWIAGLPAGSYVLAAYQEKYGESAPQTVVIKDGQNKTMNFAFKAK